MALPLETPSRIWRRIQARQDQDMPSLPSVPALDDSEAEPLTSRILPGESDENTDEDEKPQKISSSQYSTPIGSSHTARPSASASVTARLSSKTSRRSLGASIRSRNSKHDAFNISKVPSFPRINVAAGNAQEFASDVEEESKSSVPDAYLPPPEDEELDAQGLSISDALQSVSRSNSPAPFSVDAFEEDHVPNNNFNHSPESKPSPFDRFQNVAFRRTNNRVRTPSLTHTVSSQTTSPTNSTPPQSHRSPLLARLHAASPTVAAQVSFPRSRASPPAVRDESPSNTSGASESDPVSMSSAASMDITDVHSSSPIRSTDRKDASSQDEDLREESGLPSQADDTSAEEAEPTISNNAPIHYSNKLNGREHLSSPASVAFTPTPAFPRPRTRFNLPSPPKDEIPSTPAQIQPEGDEQPFDDIMTPHTRRRSFLLSVINSTARPRLKMGTPHPRNNLVTPGMASITESTPGPYKQVTERPRMRTVLAGITPRPPVGRRRISHPLAQTSVPSPAASDAEFVAGLENDRMSMISTTSSQDLTSHPHANASFDPAMGFGGGAAGHGVGRFNTGKLNSYLHTLNHRLQEENESLIEQIRVLEEEKQLQGSSATSDSNRRLGLDDASNRGLSTGTALNNVEEDPAAEQWLEEKAELEEMIESFKDEVARYMAEKEDAENALEKEKKERERDKERWKERMAEVEAGVSELVGDLERKLEVAEKKAHEVSTGSAGKIKELNHRINDLQMEIQAVNDRAEKAERALESGEDLGGALNEVNEKLVQTSTELRNANVHIQELEKEVVEVESHADELEKLHKKDQELISTLGKDVESATERLETEKARVRELEDQIQGSGDELREAKVYIDELEENTEIAAERLEVLEADIVEARTTIKRLEIDNSEDNQDFMKLKEELVKAQEANSQMKEALEEAEQKITDDGGTIMNLKSELVSLEREKERVMVNASQHVTRSVEPVGPSEEDLETLELELDGAHKEIARLNALLVQSPARRAMEKVKDARIEMLEKEKEELLGRNKMLRLTVNDMTTPQKINSSGISPIHRHVLSTSLRTPRTPGAPLRDLSWLNSTMNDPSVAPLVAEISRLRKELDRANESIDDKIDKLEDAGIGAVGLAQKLEDARGHITSLEDEIARLRRTEERRSKRLERIRCKRCQMRIDAYHILQEDDSFLDNSRLSLEPSVSHTTTTEVLRRDLQTVNEELAELKKKWKEEKKQLVNENAVLQDAANRLNAQVKEEARRLAETERKGERKRLTVENELENARKTMQELEGELKSERSRLRNLNTQQDRMQRDKDSLLSQLKRTESDIDDVRQQLQRVKQENSELEKELRENATAEQRARLLEKKVSENQRAIENLRQERSSLSNDFKDLQKRYADASERADKLRKEYASSANSHEKRQSELDVRLLEIEDLKRALQKQSTKVQRAEEEKEKVIAEKQDVSKTIAALETDLRRVRRDAETFSHDLRRLKTEKERAEEKYKDEIARLDRNKRQSQAQLKLLTGELDQQKQEIADMRDHVCTVNRDEHWVSTLKLQHNKECKGLLVQIRYLKAKFTREALFRDHLGYQKQYLLEILSQFERGERKILVAIARIGYPVAPRLKKLNKFRAVGIMIIFLSRVRRASAAWREHSVLKQEVVTALDKLHRRRAINAAS